MVKERNIEHLVKRADNDETIKKIIDIIKEREKRLSFNIFGNETEELTLDMYGYAIHMRKLGAPSSIDTLYDIFEDGRHQLFEGFDGKGSRVAVDVGANEGYYVLKLKKDEPGLEIYAFEPNPGAFGMLEKNIEANGLERVHVFHQAVSDSKEHETAFQYVDSVSAIGGFRIWGVRPWLPDEMILDLVVETTTLDDELEDVKEIDIIKVDVEGAECRVLAGAKKTLAKTRMAVIEYHGPDNRDMVKNIMESHGFTLRLDTHRECGDLYFSRD